MAVGNQFAASISDIDNQQTRLEGNITFNDSAAQPFYPGVTGALTMRGPYAVAFDTASLNAGVAIGYTPAIGDVFTVITVTTTAFNGTTPLLDVGFTGDTNGFYYEASGENAALDVSAILSTTAFDVANNSTLNATTPIASLPAWAYAKAADALLVWVSQDGTKGGTAIGGTAGAANLYILQATPLAF